MVELSKRAPPATEDDPQPISSDKSSSLGVSSADEGGKDTDKRAKEVEGEPGPSNVRQSIEAARVRRSAKERKEKTPFKSYSG